MPERTETVYATVQILINPEWQGGAEDVLSETLRDVPEILDWAYVDSRANFQPVVIHWPYEEGTFLRQITRTRKTRGTDPLQLHPWLEEASKMPEMDAGFSADSLPYVDFFIYGEERRVGDAEWATVYPVLHLALILQSPTPAYYLELLQNTPAGGNEDWNPRALKGEYNVTFTLQEVLDLIASYRSFVERLQAIVPFDMGELICEGDDLKELTVV